MLERRTDRGPGSDVPEPRGAILRRRGEEVAARREGGAERAILVGHERARGHAAIDGMDADPAIVARGGDRAAIGGERHAVDATTPGRQPLAHDHRPRSADLERPVGQARGDRPAVGGPGHGMHPGTGRESCPTGDVEVQRRTIPDSCGAVGGTGGDDVTPGP